MVKSLNTRWHHLQVEIVTDLVPCGKLHQPGLMMRYCVRLVALVTQATLNLLRDDMAVSPTRCTLRRMIILPLPIDMEAIVLLVGLR